MTSELLRNILIGRLVDRYGLDQNTAEVAADQALANIPTEYSAIVAAEAAAISGEALSALMGQLGQFWQALQPVISQFVRNFNSMAEQVDHCAKYLQGPTRPGDRPAWQSPYGPPQHRSTGKGHRG